MTKDRLETAALTRDEDLVALILPASRVFGLFAKTFDLPPFWAALITDRLGGQRICKAGSEARADDAEQIMLVRTSPLALELPIEQLRTSDGYLCDVLITLNLNVIAEKSELAAFRKNVGANRTEIRQADLQTLLTPSVRQAAMTFAQDKDTPALVAPEQHAELNLAINQACSETLFNSGLDLAHVGHAPFVSNAYRQWQLEQAQLERRRTLMDSQEQLQQAARYAQARHLEELEASLHKLKQMAEDSPAVTLGEMLKTFEDSHRPDLYQALWHVSEPSRPTRAIVIACGEELVCFRADQLDEPDRRDNLAGPAGLLRSLTCCRDATGKAVLLVGAALGAYKVDAASGQVTGTFVVGDDQAARVRGGFNASALVGEFLYATHSELGLIRWHEQRPDEGQQLFARLTTGARTVRHVQYAGGRIWFSADQQVISAAPSDADDDPAPGESSQPLIYEGSRSPITALTHTGTSILAGNAAGEILSWDTQDQQQATILYKGYERPVESITILETCGVSRLFFTDTSPALRGQVVGDAFACQYQAGGQTIRRAEVAPDLIIATNEPRDRLFCWPTHDPSATPTTILVSRLTRRSIQDVCLISSDL